MNNIEIIPQILGIGWCVLIMACVVWSSMGTYIVESVNEPLKRYKNNIN